MANEIVTKAYDIDISKTGARPIVRLSQYDTRTVRVLFTVYDGTELQTIDGCTARVDGKRSDGTTFTKPCDIDAGSKVAFTVEAEMTNSAGKHDAELVIINADGNPLGTQNFTFDVEKAPFERESAATVDDRTLYDQYTTAVDTRVTAAIDKANTSVDAAIKKADDAVTADTGKVDKLVSDTQARIDAIVSEAVTPIERGGTGATTADDARTNLGAAASSHTHGAVDITSGTLSPDRLPTVPISKGGTGATNAASARTNIGITDTGWVELTIIDGSGNAYYRVVGGVMTIEIDWQPGSTSAHNICKIPEGLVPNSERSMFFVVSHYVKSNGFNVADRIVIGAHGDITFEGSVDSGEMVIGTITYAVGY